MRTTVMRKIIVDVLMIVGMFFSMGLQLFGGGVHKMIGLLTFILFIVHNVLNWRWYKGLRRGRYSLIRIAHMVSNLAVILAMIGIIVSGVMLSKEMEAGFGHTMTASRILHNASSYAGCVGIALHIGFHLKRRCRYDD